MKSSHFINIWFPSNLMRFQLNMYVAKNSQHKTTRAVWNIWWSELSEVANLQDFAFLDHYPLPGQPLMFINSVCLIHYFLFAHHSLLSPCITNKVLTKEIDLVERVILMAVLNSRLYTKCYLALSLVKVYVYLVKLSDVRGREVRILDGWWPTISILSVKST